MKTIDDKKELQKLATAIKKHRISKGITQQEAYNDTGIHFARIEQGNRNVNYLTLVKICRYFEIDPCEFFKEN